MVFFIDKGKKLFIKGLEEINRGNYSNALSYFNKVHRNSKYYNEMLANKMGVLNELNEFEETMNIFQEVKEVYPIYYIAATNQIQALINYEKYAEVVSLFKHLKVCVPKQETLQLFWNTAIAAKEACDFKVLIELCDCIEKVRKDSIYVYYWRGIALYNQESYQEAEKELTLFIEKTLSNINGIVEVIDCMDEVLYTLVLLYQKTNCVEKANQIELEYKMYNYWKQGNDHIIKQEYNLAVFYLEKVEAEYLISNRAINDLMMAYVEDDQSEKAILLFPSIDISSVIYPLALINYLAAITNTKKYSLALNVIDTMPVKHQYFNYYSDNLYDILLLSKDFKELNRVSKQWLEYNVTANYQYKYALSLYYLKEYLESIEILKEIDSWQYQEDYVDVVYLLALCFDKLGDATEASKYYDEAYSLEHSSASAQVSDDSGKQEYYYIRGRAPFNPDVINNDSE